MIYLDTSALAKLVLPERESRPLAAFLDDHPDVLLTTSVIAEVELSRACLRANVDVPTHFLAQVAKIRLTDRVIADASRLQPPTLRSLDAIHIASALSLGTDIGHFVTYDTRQAEAASELGLAVLSPS